MADVWRRGVVLSPAVVPITLTVTWSKLTRAGVFAGSIIGAVLGMLAWMIGCWKIYGEYNAVPMCHADGDSDNTTRRDQHYNPR